MSTKRVTNPNTRDYPSLDGVVHEIPSRLAHAVADPRVRQILHTVYIFHMRNTSLYLLFGLQRATSVGLCLSPAACHAGPWLRDGNNTS